MKRFFLLFALLTVFAKGVHAQIIGATNNSSQQKQERVTMIGTRTSSKHNMRFEWQYYRGLLVSYAYQLHPNISIGAGLGTFIPTKDEYSINYGFHAFSDVAYNFTIKDGWSVFLKLRLTYEFHHVKYNSVFGAGNDYNHYLPISLQPGVSYKNFSLGIGRYGYIIVLGKEGDYPFYNFLGFNFIYNLPIRSR